MRNMSVCIRYELRKLLFEQKGIIIIGVIVLLQLLISCTAKFRTESYSFSPAVYCIYAEKYAGVFQDKTAESIAEELETQIETANQKLSGSTSTSDFEEKAAAITIASERVAALQEIQMKYLSLKNRDAVMMYDVELAEAVSSYSVNWVSLLGTVLLSVLIILNDTKCGMEQILYPSKMGKATILKAKYLVTLVLSLLVSAGCIIIQWSVLSIRWNLGTWNVPLQSLAGFENCTLHITIWQAMILSVTAQIIGTVSVGILTDICATILRKEIPTISVATFIIGIGAAFSEKYPSFLYFSIWKHISGMIAMHEMNPPQMMISTSILILRFGVLAGISLYLCKK